MVEENRLARSTEDYIEDDDTLQRRRRTQSKEHRLEIQRPEDVQNRRRRRTLTERARKTIHEESLGGLNSDSRWDEIRPHGDLDTRRRSEPWDGGNMADRDDGLLGSPKSPKSPSRTFQLARRSEQEILRSGSPIPPIRSFSLVPNPAANFQDRRNNSFGNPNYLAGWQPPVWKPLIPGFYVGSGDIKRSPSSLIRSRSGTSSLPKSESLSDMPVGFFRGVYRALYGEEECQAVQDSTDEVESYPSGLALFLILLSGAIPYIVVVLDDAVVAIIIPVLVAEFEKPADIGWYASGYFLPLTAILPLFGKGYALWQVKWLFLFALFLLILGSFLCAIAHSSTVFISGRVVAGAGAAGIFTGAMRIISMAAPKQQHMVLEGLGCVILGACTLSGAILGGVIAENIGWRWSFWINIPIAAVSAVIFILFFPAERSRSPLRSLPFWEKIKRVDILGASLLIGSLVSLSCLLQRLSASLVLKGGDIVLGIFAAVLLILFLLHQHFSRPHISFIPHKVFANRGVWSCCLGLFFLFAGFMNYVFFLAIFFQGVLGQTPESSAISMLPYVLSLTAGSAITGILVTKVRYYNPFFIVGGVLFSTGAGLILTFDVDTGMWTRVGYEIILGTGVGLLMLANVAACQTSVDEEHHSIAQGLTFLCSALGATVSLPISSTILNRTLRNKIQGLDLPFSVAAAVLLEPTKVRDFVPVEDLEIVLDTLTDSVRIVFMFGLGCAIACALAFYLVPWSPLMAFSGPDECGSNEERDEEDELEKIRRQVSEQRSSANHNSWQGSSMRYSA